MRSTTSKLVLLRLLMHTPAPEGATLEEEARGHRGKGKGSEERRKQEEKGNKR